MFDLDEYKGKIISNPYVHYNSSMDMDEYHCEVWDDKDYAIYSIFCKPETKIDASPEVIKAAKEFRKVQEIERRFEIAKQDSTEIKKGRYIEVTHGRKYPVGLIGIVFWAGISHYGYHKVYRVGFTADKTNETCWTDQTNVKVLNPVKPVYEDIAIEVEKDIVKYEIDKMISKL